MSQPKPLIMTEDLLEHLTFIRSKRQEYFICFSLDSGYQILKRRTVTIGLLNSTLVHPREVFAGPLKDRAAAIVVAHNHPSGDPDPSNADITATQQLVAAGQLLGIKLVDHIIVTKQSHFSFKMQNFI